VAVNHCGPRLGTPDSPYLAPGDWQATLSYRWFESDRHYQGSVEQAQRFRLGNEVVNNVYTTELTLARGLSKRVSLSLSLPFIHATRSSLYEHDRVNRYTTKATGIGDVRVGALAWLFDPEKHTDKNVFLGLGLKLPTGEEDASDVFYTATGPERRPVDQSIQLGDGGLGVTFDIGGFAKVAPRTFAYLSGSYLINPENQNGTRTFRETLSPRLANEAIMSVADQFLVRSGLTYALWSERGLSVSLGWRWEGVPVEDLIGNSTGFRRPGFSGGIEPGLTWAFGRNTLSASASVAIARERWRSVTDRETGRHGDAAFADYAIFASFARRF
jgi:hypothetical protein